MHCKARWTFALAAVLGLVAFLQTVAQARELLVAVPRPSPTRAAQADAIVVGRVVALEPKDIEVAGPGGAKTTYRIAVVNVTESVAGAKGVKSVRVGFVPPPMGGADPAIGAIRRPIRPGFGP